MSKCRTPTFDSPKRGNMSVGGSRGGSGAVSGGEVISEGARLDTWPHEEEAIALEVCHKGGGFP